MSDNGIVQRADGLFDGEYQVRYTLTPECEHPPLADKRFRIRSLSELQRAKYERASYRPKGDGLNLDRLADSGPRLIVMCVVDNDGNTILTDKDVAKIKAKWDPADVGMLARVCREHCGFRDLDEAAVKNDEPASKETTTAA